MLTSHDLQQLLNKNISENQLHEQLNCFAKGFPFLDVKGSASVEKGIQTVSTEEQDRYIKIWDRYLEKNKTILKFVPASGAASRMFKDLFGFLDASYDVPTSDFEKTFFDQITHFAFYEALNAACLRNEGKDIPTLKKENQFKAIVSNLLDKKGLNYGFLPKGLLFFHSYPEGARTAMEEHLIESALYAANKGGDANVHFTVSPEHQDFFEEVVREKSSLYEKKYNVKFDITFSTQQPQTDTIAVDEKNEPFRETDGSLLFRPGGHGALIDNLNQIDADVAFIKNIDNVVPDHLKGETIRYKKILAGILAELQEKIFSYLSLIESGEYVQEQIEEMIYFLQDDLFIKNPDTKFLEDVELILYIKEKLSRPLRVCGMVRNVGEPGGGPFFAVNSDETISLQILESTQIDLTIPEMKTLFEKGTHFNPVDLVCGLKKPNGEKYYLPDYVDKNTGFISYKSKDGRDLKALELPGLWNGAMSNWNTVFVEVPIETFNPVKTVNDLLRPQHQ